MNSGGAPRVPNTTNIHFDCIEGEAMVIALDLKGLSVSTGAACSSGAIEPSHVLTAMGLSADRRAPASASAWASRTRRKTSTSHSIVGAGSRGRLRELSPVYKKRQLSAIR